MSIVCDGQLMDNIIAEFGETIYLRVAQSRTLSDEYATETTVWKQYKIKGLMNVYTADNDEVREGKYYIGEITFLLDTAYESLAIPTNMIYYPPDGVFYEILRLRKYKLGDTVYVLEVTVAREGKVISETIQTTITSSAVITA